MRCLGPWYPWTSSAVILMRQAASAGDCNPPYRTRKSIEGSLAASAGVKWFEVDKLDVLNAKRRSLEAAGASCKPGQGARFTWPAHSYNTCPRIIGLRQ